MINIIEGNILSSGKDVIVQQVNCKGRMGSGLAEQIMNKYPNVKKEYQAFYNKMKKTGLNDEEILGLVNYVDTYDETIIANIFGQEDIRQNKFDKNVYTKKYALLCGIEKIKEKAQKLNFSVAIPTYIGCGLAGGNWKEIKPEIEKIFENSGVDVTFYHYR